MREDREMDVRGLSLASLEVIELLLDLCKVIRDGLDLGVELHRGVSLGSRRETESRLTIDFLSESVESSAWRRSILRCATSSASVAVARASCFVF